VCENLLEQRIVDELRDLGARGYIVTDVRGEGTSGVRAGEWEGEVKIEAIVSPEEAARIVEQVGARYVPRFAVILYTSDVEVTRT
jgi:nitrogen regulatory protein PII